jgi:hypothetical protein
MSRAENTKECGVEGTEMLFGFSGKKSHDPITHLILNHDSQEEYNIA